MGVITRSEASHRFKIISSHINSAVAATREGHWGDAKRAAIDAQHLLDTLVPHLEEVANAETELVGSLKYNPPIVQGRTGGMGYRGSAHIKPKLVKNNRCPCCMVGQRKHTSDELELFHGVHPKTNSIVTPPPPRVFTPEPQAGSVPPEPEKTAVTFDLAVIPGEVAYSLPRFPITTEQQEGLTRWATLSDELKGKIRERFTTSGKPVTVKLRPVDIRVGYHGG